MLQCTTQMVVPTAPSFRVLNEVRRLARTAGIASLRKMAIEDLKSHAGNNTHKFFLEVYRGYCFKSHHCKITR
jgi:hypothetical protein